MDASEVTGPIDYLLLEFDPAKADGSVAAALSDLVERGIIALYDFLCIVKSNDGDVAVMDVSGDGLGGFDVFAGARSGLLDDDDVSQAGSALEPGRAAALFVYENKWAVPFIAAALEVDASVVASERIPSEVIMATLDALDTADSGN